MKKVKIVSFYCKIIFTFFFFMLHISNNSFAMCSFGDSNCDGIVDLKDTILPLQIVSGNIAIEQNIPEDYEPLNENEIIIQNNIFSYIDTLLEDNVELHESENYLKTVDGVNYAKCNDSNCYIVLNTGLSFNYFNENEDINFNSNELPNENILKSHSIKTYNKSLEIKEPLKIVKILKSNSYIQVNKKALVLWPFAWQSSSNEQSVNLIVKHLNTLNFSVDIIKNENVDRLSFQKINQDYGVVIIISHGGLNGAIATGVKRNANFKPQSEKYGIGRVSGTGIWGTNLFNEWYETITSKWWEDVNLNNKIIMFAACNLFSNNENNQLLNVISQQNTSVIGFSDVVYSPHHVAFFSYITYEAGHDGDSIKLSFEDALSKYNNTYTKSIAKISDGENMYLVEKNDLIAHFKFDGDLTDSSGNRNHGQILGEISYASGVSNQCVKFNGNGTVGFVEYLPGGSEFTISFWIKLEEMKGTQHILHFYTNGSNPTDGSRNSLYTDSTGKLGCYHWWEWGSQTTDYFETGDNFVNDKEFTFICIVRNNNEVIIYKNGKEVFYEETTMTGSYKEVGKSLKGYIDDLRFYNRALNSYEIQLLHNR